MADLRSALIVDCDTGGGTELVNAVNLRLSASGGSIEAIGQQLMAVSIPVVIASNQSSLPVDTEMGPAATLTDNFATPSTGTVGAFNMVYDGATWDFARGTAVDGVLVNLGTNNDVDTEMSAAATLTDNFANPTCGGVAAFGMGWDGSAWDRLSVVGGKLQVDVLSGGGSPAAPTSPTADYITSAAVAAGAEVNLDSVEAAGKSLAQVTVWSSVAFRCRVFLVNNAVEATEALAVGGGQPHTPWTWTPPHALYATLGTSAGLDAFRIEYVSMDDQNAADAHACILFQG